ncbi:MAG: nuclear transport factor 2 family protein [Novosphingobium sp.]|nr:nuclear transport factor 2 family protein [Novosphingobium sp.]
MTIDDLLAREAIRDTLAKYNVSGDRLKAEDYAACFTEDGIIESTTRGVAENFRFDGRAAIFEWQNRWRSAKPGEAQKDVVRKATFVRHNLTTCKIDLTGPETAKVRTYWIVMSDNGPDHCGVYLDEFRKVGEDWLIAHRKVRTDWHAPDSLFSGD